MLATGQKAGGFFKWTSGSKLPPTEAIQTEAQKLFNLPRQKHWYVFMPLGSQDYVNLQVGYVHRDTS